MPRSGGNEQKFFQRYTGDTVVQNGLVGVKDADPKIPTTSYSQTFSGARVVPPPNTSPKPEGFKKQEFFQKFTKKITVVNGTVGLETTPAAEVPTASQDFSGPVAMDTGVIGIHQTMATQTEIFGQETTSEAQLPRKQKVFVSKIDKTTGVVGIAQSK
ncbi:hypothetical protein C8F01DRAFT_1147152 [Mycena amicta]|nr:hypothetical protein C8F01DRAFT_1147152 [Mycena amicta]